MEDNFKERVKELRDMDPDTFKAFIDSIRSDIWSFPNMIPPSGAEKIGEIDRNGEVYHYYLSPEGVTYFENDSGFRFKKRMEKIHTRFAG